MHHKLIGGQLALPNGTKLPLSKAARAGDFVFLSGQLGLGADGKLAGDDIEAKRQVTSLNSDLGFQTLDVGDLSQSLHLEHMTLLWVKMVRANGHHPNFTWAYLER